MGSHSKLTREQAIKIREIYERKAASVTTIAARYRVSSTTINNIIKGKTKIVSDLPDIARPPVLNVRGKFILDKEKADRGRESAASRHRDPDGPMQ